MPAPVLAWVLAASLWSSSPTEIEFAPLSFARATVSGRITDAGTGEALTGARVFISGQTTSVLSGDGGEYSFILPGDGWDGREVEMRTELAGYESLARTVRLSGPTTRVDLAMTPGADMTLMHEMRIAPSGQPAPPPPSGQPAVREAVGVDAARRVSGAGFAPVSADAGPVRPPRPPFNTESYAHIEEADFLGVEDNPLSTFAIDVDRASYANMRRFIDRGMRPPIDAIRIEELVNYFTYDYPSPRGAHPLSITTEVGTAPWQPAHRLLRIGIQGRNIAGGHLPASNLVFLIDVSGSMQPPAKLPLLKSSLRLLVAQMRPADRVAIVVYAGQAGLALPPTSGENRSEILFAIDRLEAGGSTAGGAGLRLAYEVARENFNGEGNNRVILASDGDFNVGPSSDAEMIRLIEKERESGVFLSVLGFGTGNLQDSKMEQLANHGNGSYAYIDGEREAAKVLVSEFAGTLFTIAKDVKVQVEFNPREVQAYRLIGYENRALRAEDFADDRKDAGELGAGHTVTALYEIVPSGIDGPDLADTPPLRYRDRADVTGRAASGELGFVQLRYKRPDDSKSVLVQQAFLDRGGDGSGDMRFAASVAGFGMLLRESAYAGDYALGDVLELARGSLGDDEEGYRREFVRLVRDTRAQGLLER
ncbi:MAG: von Willebrand factor type A domain-containing protein [Gammaproteobacteria bacterium]|nr:von Willebrand factor type A domain-containing protein [Gammaproteobacteria bacterium]